MRITTVIADDHPLIRSGFKNILLEDPDIELLGEAGNGLELLQLLLTVQPQIILLDLMMPRMSGLEAGRIIRETYPAINLVVLSMSDDDRDVREAWGIGAKAYLLKDSEPEEVLRAVKAVSLGGTYYSGEIQKKISHLLGRGTGSLEGKESCPVFTATETRILKLVCKGLTVKEIGVVTVLAQKTVEHYLERMKQKTEAKNIAELAAYAVLQGIVIKSDLI